MKHYRFLFSVLTAGLVLAGLVQTSSTPAQAQDTGSRAVIYLFNQDYPPAGIVQHPTHPAQRTEFWQLLDKAMATTEGLALTESLDDANYRVELKCAGITHCSKLRVYVQSPNRDVLTSFTLHKARPLFFPPTNVTMEDVAKRLAEHLQESINGLAEGGYGYQH